MSEAARVGDPIEHSSALGGLLAGLAIGAGAVLIGIAVVGTAGLGGAAVVAMLGAGAATGAGIGQLLGSLSFAQRETGRIMSGSSNVFVNGKPAARAHVDYAECSDHAGVSKTVAQGSRSVHINGVPAARVGDRTVCDARISAGSSNVFIGGETETTDEISPEVPGWLDGAVLGVGLASAIALVGPAMALWGLFGGMVGGGAGYRLGGERYGEGSDEQKLMASGAAFIVGGLSGRYRLQLNGGLGVNFGNIKPRIRRSKGFVGLLRGREYELPGVRVEKFLYVKRSNAERMALRRVFDSVERARFLKDLSGTVEGVNGLKRAGFNGADIRMIQSGKLPSKEWQVHHIKPLDDGGTNDFDNLVLIKLESYHRVFTNVQKSLSGGMKEGESRMVDWSMIDVKIYPGFGSSL
ncbi:PAAR domain-containing protein [Pseudomonas plecoglossicida]|uniref:PAAR domain-containing protein n=1 Tax=Pseudomonas plecoglossicida TaxID=70775 RepID=UPI0034E1E577